MSPAHPQRPKAVLYARVSSKDQEKEGFSIPAQRKLLKTYAEEHNLRVVSEYVDIETAKRTGRKGFAEMVRFFKSEAESRDEAERCRTLLVEKTDRLYRNLRDWVVLDDLDLEIHFVKEGVTLSRDSRSTEKFMHGIKVLMAKNYIDNLSEEVRKGMIEKAEQGIYPSFAPLGYRNVTRADGKRAIEPDPELTPLIRKLYEWYATGDYSLSQTAKKAREEGLAYRKSDCGVQTSTVHKILRNPIYCGEFLWKGERYPGCHEPIISRELYERVQEAFDNRAANRAKYRKHRWAFQGLVRCGHCGCAMTAERKKSRYVYYHCTGHKGKCPEKYVREEQLVRQFGEALKAIHMDDEVHLWTVNALRRSHRDEKRHHDEAIARLQGQYQKLQDRIDAMYVDKLDGKISQAFFSEKSAQWRREQDGILRSIERHQTANEGYIEEGIRLLELAQEATALYERQETAEKRQLLEMVFSNSSWKHGRLEPCYRQPFDMLVDTNAAYERDKAAMPRQEAIKKNWLPGQDSNLRQPG